MRMFLRRDSQILLNLRHSCIALFPRYLRNSNLKGLSEQNTGVSTNRPPQCVGPGEMEGSPKLETYNEADISHLIKQVRLRISGWTILD